MATSINIYPRDWQRIADETVAVPESEITVAATWVDDDGAAQQGECTVRLSHILTHLDVAAQDELSRDLLVSLARRMMGISE